MGRLCCRVESQRRDENKLENSKCQLPPDAKTKLIRLLDRYCDC